TGIGKMFGVLVVQNKDGKLGYLAAFSGKLADSNHHKGFVPPVFDILKRNGFFKKGEAELNAMNQELEILESEETYLLAKKQLEHLDKTASQRLADYRKEMKTAKKERKQKRLQAQQEMTNEDFAVFNEQLRQESLRYNFYYKDLVKYWKNRLATQQHIVDQYALPIATLRQTRRQKSAALQRQLFEQYQFLNQAGERKSLLDIFSPTTQSQPPAGAGECAAPKLLQYAFMHALRPIAMAEFWWGKSPNSAIRKHGYFYPACRGKCEPILAHMLKGMSVDDNPILVQTFEDKTITVVYEDDDILVINKPAGFLSVPGIHIKDCVHHRIQQRYPDATGPLIVHRLDMCTSGIMLIAKHKIAHKILQQQFIKRSIQKRYVALLDGIVSETTGYIDLPLRVDLENRPHQMVCYEYGKSARTRWEVVERTDTKTRVHFYPITGRTHQLRVHAAHPLGLNTPIVGDDLYGTRANRLHLHAAWIAFRHPTTQQQMEIDIQPPF
ncbi:MAG: pseudouridine synthase, partial [Bacteroidota bacterium]